MLIRSDQVYKIRPRLTKIGKRWPKSYGVNQIHHNRYEMTKIVFRLSRPTKIGQWQPKSGLIYQNRPKSRANKIGQRQPIWPNIPKSAKIDGQHKIGQWQTKSDNFDLIYQNRPKSTANKKKIGQWQPKSGNFDLKYQNRPTSTKISSN